MRVSTTLCLPLAALLLVVGLIPTSGWASTGRTTQNCPTEPVQGTPVVSGETFWGANCVLHSIADVDSFVFKGEKGQTWNPVLGLGTPITTNICLAVLPPGSRAIFADILHFPHEFSSDSRQ